MLGKTKDTKSKMKKIIAKDLRSKVIKKSGKTKLKSGVNKLAQLRPGYFPIDKKKANQLRAISEKAVIQHQSRIAKIID